jgi:hypothetical protein
MEIEIVEEQLPCSMRFLAEYQAFLHICKMPVVKSNNSRQGYHQLGPNKPMFAIPGRWQVRV